MKIIKKFMERKKWKKNNNKIYLIKKNGKKILFPNIKGMKFFIDGKNNTIEIYEPIVYNDTGDTNADLYDFTERMTKVIEEQIIAHPTQWIWFQKRWNTRPEQQKVKHHTVKTKVVNK